MRENYYSMVLVSSERSLKRFLVHNPEPDPDIATLPGVKELYQVIVTTDKWLEISSAYTSTKVF